MKGHQGPPGIGLPGAKGDRGDKSIRIESETIFSNYMKYVHVQEFRVKKEKEGSRVPLDHRVRQGEMANAVPLVPRVLLVS